MTSSLNLLAVPGIPMVQPGDDLAVLLIAAMQRADIQPQAQDILVIAQKIISKSENRYVDLASVTPSEQARQLAAKVDKDPRFVEVVLSESKAVVRHRPGVLIVEHRLGYVMANAGIDRSNIESEQRVLLLPENPDASCAMFKTRLEAHYDVPLAVIINDSVGRAWRSGIVSIALGAAGLPALYDIRGEVDLYGRELQVTQLGFADEIAAAASLIMGQAAEGLPLVLVRGLCWPQPHNNANALIRDKKDDLFR